MALEVRQPATWAERLSSEITRQRQDSAAHARTVEQLRGRVYACEVKFNVRSSDIHQAIDSGELVETSEVCRWIMDYDMLVRAGKA